MPYQFVTSPCGVCRTLIWYNPDLVPALNISGEKQAVCPSCVATYNALHPELEDFVIAKGAYEPQEVP